MEHKLNMIGRNYAEYEIIKQGEKKFNRCK